MNITIEKFDIATLDECADLYMKTYAAEPWNESWESRDIVVDYIRKWYLNNYFIGFTGKQNGKIVAVSLGYRKPYIQGDEYCINDYFVDPDLQRQGIGGALMEGIKKELTTLNISSMILSTQRGIPAHAFYEKHGFFTLDDAIVMVGDV